MKEYSLPRCQVIPDADHQVAYTIDGREVLRWNFGHHYPRPFFHPVLGPSGANLVRMGHPGAPNHDHHAGIWFAHNSVEAFDFWANGTGTQIRQRQWLDYVDSDQYCASAVVLDYYDGHEQTPLLTQETIAIIHPLPKTEFLLELAVKLSVPQGHVTLNQTNFGLLAVRVAATISEHFGGGTITNDNGTVHESNLFGKASSYMDYSGPVPNPDGEMVTNGITLFDHPSNPSYPSKWHVREDGWMGPSINRDEALTITPDKPLLLRYQLHVHAGALTSKTAGELHERFKQSKGWEVIKSTARHRAWEIRQQT